MPVVASLTARTAPFLIVTVMPLFTVTVVHVVSGVTAPSMVALLTGVQFPPTPGQVAVEPAVTLKVEVSIAEPPLVSAVSRAPRRARSMPCTASRCR